MSSNENVQEENFEWRERGKKGREREKKEEKEKKREGVRDSGNGSMIGNSKQVA